MNLRYTLFFILMVLVSFQACIKEEFPTDLGAEEINQVIQSPCNYTNWAEVKSEIGMTGTVTVKRNKTFDYDDILLGFSSSPNEVRIRYNETRGFQNIKSQVVDFGPGPYSGVEMDIDFYGTTNRTLEAVSGKLYIAVQADGSIKMDWCNVQLYDKMYSLYRTTTGGCLVKF